MNKFNADTLGNALFTHTNDYGFDVLNVIESFSTESYPSVSVIIPYFKVGELFHYVINHLQIALSNLKYEVIVIDDGSINVKARDILSKSKISNFLLVENSKNEGIIKSRCNGLSLAKNDISFFMDADIIIDSKLIENHLKVHKFCSENTHRNCITVSFFEFTDFSENKITKYPLNPENIEVNDFRIHCTYKDTWIGCEEDKEFIDKEFNLVQDTDCFRSWHNMVGPWALTNMVLGGFFATDRKASLRVGGFSNLFEGYGFTETPLPTKLVAMESSYIIPIVVGGALHIGGKEVDIKQTEKDKIFRKKHDFYFNTYLNLSIDEALKDKCI